MIYNCCSENRKSAVLNNPASITAIAAIHAPGSGYAVGDVLTIAQTGSSGSANVTVNAISGTGGVTGISLSQNGALYSAATGVATTGGKGSWCTLDLACTPNGIDYLEVAFEPGGSQPPILSVYCLKSAPANLSLGNILITGGESINDVVATRLEMGSAPNVFLVHTNHAGDFSTYTLRLVNAASEAATAAFDVAETLTGFDPQLAEVSFGFRVDCGPEFDCKPPSPGCPPDLPAPPAINYLAKDYGSFRTVILDRLNQLLPSWGAKTEADLGMALAELLAYRADHLSYQQDAIATEAYIETARSRVSLRRHALLMDCHVHDGCNARAWIRLRVAGNPGDRIFMDRTLTRFSAYAPGMPSTLAVGAGNDEAAMQAGVQVFEPMQDAILFPEHNEMHFYTWGDTDCCLPIGATQATLAGSFPNLSTGDVLIFAEVIGPQTGNQADADLRHRCAVRLTQVATTNASGQLLVDPLYDSSGNPITTLMQTPAPLTEIKWSDSDALPFPVCISSTYIDSASKKTVSVSNISIVYGNVVLADHGLSIERDNLWTVPGPRLFYPPAPGGNRCREANANPIPVRFRPAVPDAPLTQAVPLPLAGTPVTPSVVMLGGAGVVNLTDSNGFTCLTVQAANPADWPALFGITVRHNQATPANFDLSVAYSPNGGPAGMTAPPIVEQFANLSLTTTDANYVANRINSASMLIQVPSTYVPPATAPAGFPAGITPLTSAGTISLKDSGNPAVTYLTLQTTSQASWPNYVAVLAEATQPQPACCTTIRPQFTLLIVYNPPSPGTGVPLPVTLEQLTPPSQPTIAGVFTPGSQLVKVHSYAEAPGQSLSATDLTSFDAGDAVPVICLCGDHDGVTIPWTPQQDLLGSDESARVFVVETESDGTASLRFATPADPGSAETTNGLVPEESTVFTPRYRIGNGTSGNVGAESLNYLAAADARIQSCTNPLPAAGGADPETNEQIRRRAPRAFLAQERSITMADFEASAESNPQVDKSVASLRWTGSWYSVFLAAEPKGGGKLTPPLQEALTRSVESYRLTGQDIKLESPEYVSLEITLQVCVDPDYFQLDVEQSVFEVLGNKILPNGNKGLFYPDNFTFGQTVYLSPVYLAARSVPGVSSVTATQFQPQGVNTKKYLAAGEIKLGSLQIARLENDASLPDHGKLTLVMQGGK